MNGTLNITCIQADLVWQNPSRNIENFTKKIEAIKEPTDIIVLQEMFSTGFTMEQNEVAETMDGMAVKWMLKIAKIKQCLVMGSLIIVENKAIYNRCVVAFPDGEILHYDKRHLFSYAGEDKKFNAGVKRLVFTYKGFKICPLVCYDLRFPVWARNTDEIDLLIYMANWPKPRIQAWDVLLQARAIENLCYTVGVNRVGTDANGLEYVGHTAVYDFFGNKILATSANKEAIKTVELNKKEIVEMRNKFGFLADRDTFQIIKP